jgi:hypothetical protein
MKSFAVLLIAILRSAAASVLLEHDRGHQMVDEVTRIVSVLAIGIKDRNRLLIGGKEFK